MVWDTGASIFSAHDGYRNSAAPYSPEQKLQALYVRILPQCGGVSKFGYITASSLTR